MVKDVHMSWRSVFRNSLSVLAAVCVSASVSAAEGDASGPGAFLRSAYQRQDAALARRDWPAYFSVDGPDCVYTSRYATGRWGQGEERRIYAEFYRTSYLRRGQMRFLAARTQMQDIRVAGATTRVRVKRNVTAVFAGAWKAQYTLNETDEDTWSRTRGAWVRVAHHTAPTHMNTRPCP